MRTMQRAFLRAGIKFRHSEGFNPHPVMALALPLSVGQESECELMDFETTDAPETEELLRRMDGVFPRGISAARVYVPARKVGEIRWLETRGLLEYDGGVSDEKISALNGYFAEKSIIIRKKTKSGDADIDVAPMIVGTKLTRLDDTRVELRSVIAAQNPTMNPDGFVRALETHRAELKPDFAVFRRLALFDAEMKPFE
jgi:radical SAM-linked protein